MQVSDAVAPRVAEYMPAMQLVQVLSAVAPRVTEYLPAAQSVQVLDAANEYLPAMQLVQKIDAATAVYLPAGQLSHAVVTELTKPGALHNPLKPNQDDLEVDLKITLTKPVEDEMPGF
jgi:hypothetical protein